MSVEFDSIDVYGIGFYKRVVGLGHAPAGAGSSFCRKVAKKHNNGNNSVKSSADKGETAAADMGDVQWRSPTRNEKVPD